MRNIFAVIGYAESHLTPGNGAFLQLSLLATAHGARPSDNSCFFQTQRPDPRAKIHLGGCLEDQAQRLPVGWALDMDVFEQLPCRLEIRNRDPDFVVSPRSTVIVGDLFANLYDSSGPGLCAVEVEQVFLRSTLTDDSFGLWLPMAGQDLSVFSPRDDVDDELALLRIKDI